MCALQIKGGRITGSTPGEAYSQPKTSVVKHFDISVGDKDSQTVASFNFNPYVQASILNCINSKLTLDFGTKDELFKFGYGSMQDKGNINCTVDVDLGRGNDVSRINQFSGENNIVTIDGGLGQDSVQFKPFTAKDQWIAEYLPAYNNGAARVRLSDPNNTNNVIELMEGIEVIQIPGHGKVPPMTFKGKDVLQDFVSYINDI
jgi:hypothetical protein